MSIFIDKLNFIHKTSLPAIGFQRPKEVTETYPMVILSSLSRTDFKKTKNLINNGIDAAIIHAKDIDLKHISETLSSLEKFPIGLMLDENIDQTISNDLISSGLDFLIFGLNTSVELVNKEKIGKILQIETTLPHGLVRAINELDSLVDAVFINSDNSAVTYERILNYQLFSNLINKPLLINVDSNLSKTELANLHKIGIKGLIFPEGTQSKVFNELKKMLTGLPKTQKKSLKAGVILPQISPQTETSVEKEEEEEEDDDDI